jgi:hypothetical protein
LIDFRKEINLPTRIPGLEKRSRQRLEGRNGIRDVEKDSEPLLLFGSITGGLISGRFIDILSSNLCGSS